MRGLLVVVAVMLIAFVALLATGMVSIDQTQTARVPDVKLEGGQAPEFDVDVGTVDVETVNRTVEVPTVEIRKAEGKDAPAE